MNAMRTVYLINLSFGLAGTERRFANIWRVLRERGNVNPILVVPDTLADALYRAGLAERGEAGLRTIREPGWSRALERVQVKSPGDTLMAVIRSRVVARAYRPVWDQIARDPSAVMHIGLNCSALTPPDGPIVYECMDSTLQQFGTRHYVRAAARRSVVNCQTERIRDALERTMASRRPLWNTVTSPCYFATYPDRSGTARPRDPMLAAFVGRLSGEKNPLLFIEAIAALRARGVPARGLVLGEGPLLPSVRERVESLGLQEVIELGFSQDPGGRLTEAAVYVSFQRGDNYGSQSLLEAMGAGCAIIASDVGETRAVVHDDNGLLVPLDAEALTSALASLLQDPLRATRMGDAASRLVRTQYTAEAYAAFLESLYDQAVDLHGMDAGDAPVTLHAKTSV
jgi:glycosyltransferase involved in cell wall biosynthesis